MASNILSRFLPPAAAEPSIYETLAQPDDTSDQSDLEERVGIALDNENLDTEFRDYDVGDAFADAGGSRMAAPGREGVSRPHRERVSKGTSGRVRATPSRSNLGDMDDEVPQSLLIEDGPGGPPVSSARQAHTLPPPVPGPTSHGVQARWQTVQEQQRLYQDTLSRQNQPRTQQRYGQPMSMMDPKERALWMWANVENLDNFLQDVYDYFVGNGIWSIYLSRVLNLL